MRTKATISSLFVWILTSVRMLPASSKRQDASGGKIGGKQQSSHRRTACGMYLWDAGSAFLHKWCTYLMKDCVYDGRGGRKVSTNIVSSCGILMVPAPLFLITHFISLQLFCYQFVRIEPGSVLQLLYPCSRYSPDRCLICGGCFQDHLTLWWAKHLYTPYDLYLDRTLEECIDEETTHGDYRMERNERRRNSRLDSRTNARYFFYRRYVNDETLSRTDSSDRLTASALHPQSTNKKVELLHE